MKIIKANKNIKRQIKEAQPDDYRVVIEINGKSIEMNFKNYEDIESYVEELEEWTSVSIYKNEKAKAPMRRYFND